MKTFIGKKRYSIPEIYGIMVKAFRSFSDMKRGRETGLLSEQLQERIMLAVTAVNRCALCSYAHTGMALKAGLSQEEITTFLDAETFPDLPPDEGKAVLFAQHYADTRGVPDRTSWDALTTEYGREKALCILAAARIIMTGNALGIAFGSLGNRFKGKSGDPRSGILYELGILVLLIPMVLLGAVQSILMGLFRVPKISFR